MQVRRVVTVAGLVLTGVLATACGGSQLPRTGDDGLGYETGSVSQGGVPTAIAPSPPTGTTTPAPGVGVPLDQPRRVQPKARFVVASFNVLGASHTRGRDRRDEGAPRARLALSILDERDVSVAGLQEIEPEQYHAIIDAGNGKWTMYPGMSLGEREGANSIAWRTDVWKPTYRATFKFPYFKGKARDAPVVVLRHRKTKVQVAFVNVHNPANTARWGNNARWRREALEVEAREILRIQQAGLPVIVTGDFNEIRPAYCHLTKVAKLNAANGPSAGGDCNPPRGAGIDWIFGSGEISFPDYASERSSIIDRATDHPLIVASVVVPPPSATPAN